jgi:hypothetical protein
MAVTASEVFGYLSWSPWLLDPCWLLWSCRVRPFARGQITNLLQILLHLCPPVEGSAGVHSPEASAFYTQRTPMRGKRGTLKHRDTSPRPRVTSQKTVMCVSKVVDMPKGHAILVKKVMRPFFLSMLDVRHWLAPRFWQTLAQKFWPCCRLFGLIIWMIREATMTTIMVILTAVVHEDCIASFSFLSSNPV